MDHFFKLLSCCFDSLLSNSKYNGTLFKTYFPSAYYVSGTTKYKVLQKEQWPFRYGLWLYVAKNTKRDGQMEAIIQQKHRVLWKHTIGTFNPWKVREDSQKEGHLSQDLKHEYKFVWWSTTCSMIEKSLCEGSETNSWITILRVRLSTRGWAWGVDKWWGSGV